MIVNRQISKFMKQVFSLLFLAMSVMAFGQGAGIIAENVLKADLDNYPLGVFGESHDAFLAFESKHTEKGDRGQGALCIRSFNKNNLRPIKLVVIDGIVVSAEASDNLFIGGGLVGNSIAVVWNDPKKNTIKIKWLNAQTLDEEGESHVFDFPPDAKRLEPTFTPFLDYKLNFQKHQYTAKVSISDNGQHISVGVLENRMGKPAMFKAKVMNAEKKEVGDYRTNVPFLKAKNNYSWVLGCTDKGAVVSLISPYPDVSPKAIKSAAKGMFYGVFRKGMEGPKFISVPTAQNYTGSVVLKIKNERAYFGGISSKVDDVRLIAGNFSVEKMGTITSTISPFPTDVHAQMNSKNPKKYSKSLDKAESGAYFIPYVMFVKDIDVTGTGDIIVTTNEIHWQVNSNQDLTYRFERLIFSKMKPSGEFIWNKVLHRSILGAGAYNQWPFFVQGATTEDNKVLVFINSRVSELYGINLETKEMVSSKSSLVTIDDDGNWNEEAILLNDDDDNLLVYPQTLYHASDGSFVFGASPLILKKGANYLKFRLAD